MATQQYVTIVSILNASKSELLNIPSSYDQFPIITIYDIVIVPSNEIRYLGVTLERDITLNSHINNISKKANRKLYLIRHVRKCINKDLCRILVSSLDLSPIDYCCSVLQGIPVYRLRPLIRTIRASVRTIFRIQSTTTTTTTTTINQTFYLDTQIDVDFYRYKLCNFEKSTRYCSNKICLR